MTTFYIFAFSGNGGKLVIWNVEREEIVFSMDFKGNAINSLSWNEDGSLLAATLKDKRLVVIDIRKETVVAVHMS